jgi:hypothetical protein
MPYADPLPPMLKRQYNTTMTEQKQTYKRIIKRVTGRLLNWTIEHIIVTGKVLFISSPHFLLLIFTPDAHLAHCLLPAIALTKQKGKSQRAKLPTLLMGGLISKVILNSKIRNNLVTL